MKKIFFIIIFFLLFTTSVKASSLAIPSPQKVELNGKEVGVRGYLINNNNYLKIRDLAAVLKDTEAFFNVSYNKIDETVVIMPKVEYLGDKNDLKPLPKVNKNAIKSPQKFYMNEVIKVEVYSVEGNNYLKLRDMANILGFIVKYDEKRNVVEIGSRVRGEFKVGMNEEIKLPAFPKEGISLRKYLYGLSFNAGDSKMATPNYDATKNILVLLTETGENIQLGSLKAVFNQDSPKDLEISNEGLITIKAMESVGAKFDKPYTIIIFLVDGATEIPLFSLKY